MIRGKDVQRRFSVPSLEDSVTMFFQHLFGQTSHELVIFHQQDRSPMSLGQDRFRLGVGLGPNLVFGRRKIHLKGSAASRFTVNPDVASALRSTRLNSS